MNWIDVPGFPGFSVNERGQVRGPSGKVLRPNVVRGGYLRVQITRGKYVMVHRLVLLAFVGPCPRGHEVNHRNGDTGDNGRRNLEYVRPAQNRRHAVLVLKRERRCVRLDAAAIYLIRQLRLSAPQVAQQFGISERQAQRVLSGASWKTVRAA